MNKGKKLQGRGCSHSRSPGPPLVADLYPPRQLLLWPVLGRAARIACTHFERLQARREPSGRFGNVVRVGDLVGVGVGA